MSLLTEYTGGGLLLKQQLITVNSDWVRPTYMVGDTVYVTMIGGGSSGGGSGSAGWGGWGGQYVIDVPINIGALTSVSCTIGLGGVAPALAGAAPVAGGVTSFGALISMLGGSTVTRAGGAPGGAPASTNQFNGQDTPLGLGGKAITQGSGGGGGLVLDQVQLKAPASINNEMDGAWGYGAGGAAAGTNTSNRGRDGVKGAILIKWPERS